MGAEYTGERVATNDGQVKKMRVMLSSRDSEIRDLKYSIGELERLHAARAADLMGKISELQNSLKWYKSKVKPVTKPRTSKRATVTRVAKEAENAKFNED